MRASCGKTFLALLVVLLVIYLFYAVINPEKF